MSALLWALSLSPVCLSGLARKSLNSEEKTIIEEAYKGYKDLFGVQLSSLNA